MLSERELSAAIGSTAYGPDGQKIGTVEHFFTDDRTGAPTWVAVSTGLLGIRSSVVPATEATFVDGALQLPVTRDAVRTAPHVPDEHLDPDAEERLRRHYREAAAAADRQGTGGAAGSEQTVPAPAVGGAAAGGAVGGATAGSALAGTGGAAGTDTVEVAPGTGPATGGVPAQDTGGAMTRSEEQLRVGTERVATTRARLVKYVVTEEVTITVPVRREEIRVEQVPVDAPDPGPGESLAPDPAGGTAAAGGAAGLPEEIVLHAERPVVSVEVVPVERVRLRTEVVTGQEQVTEQVQREQVVVDEERFR